MGCWKIVSRPAQACYLVAMLFVSFPVVSAILTVGPHGDYESLTAALSAVKDFDIIEIAAGTYEEPAPIQIEGFTGLTITAAPTASVTIRSTPATSANKLMTLSNCKDFTLQGDTQSNRLVLQGQNSLVIFANEHSANQNTVLTTVEFSGQAGAVGAVSCVRGTTFNDCRWTNTGNGAVIQGGEDVTFNDCRFELGSQNMSISNRVASPAKAILNRCLIRGNNGSGGQSFVGAFAMNGAGGSELIATECEFQSFLWILNGNYITGSDKEITLIDPIFTAGQWGIASIANGYHLNVQSSDPANKLDLRGFADIGLVRLRHGMVDFTDCIIASGGEGEAIKLWPTISLDDSVTINANRCFFTSGARIINDNPEGGSGSITYNFTNCIFKVIASGFFDTTNSMAESINLTHCTVYPSPSARDLDMMRCSANDTLNATYCIFDGYWQNTINADIPLKGSRNLIHSANGSDFGGTLPADTVFFDPQLDENGYLLDGSPAIDAAIGSELDVDIDFQSRPEGSENDIGADELGGGSAGKEEIVINVQIEVDKSQVGMGRSVELTARALLENGWPAVDCLLLPYVNGKRWGAFAYADQSGRATFHIPLPTTGLKEIKVEARPPEEQWIWAPRVFDTQTVYLQGTFSLPEAATESRFWFGVDNTAVVYLNGQQVGVFNGYGYQPPMDVTQILQAGKNVMSVQASNDTSVAGVLMRLEIETARSRRLFLSGKDWQSYGSAPLGWPGIATTRGEQTILLGTPEAPPFYASMRYSWPTEPDRAARFAGYDSPAVGNFSNAVQVQVNARSLQYIPSDPDHLVGAQYCILFGPVSHPSFKWDTAHAVPLMGYYWASNPDVVRQHLIWLAESGIDFLVIDWVSTAFNLDSWANRSAAIEQRIASTTNVLETMAAMRDEGLSVPKMVLLLGICNGPCAEISVVNEEIEWIYQNYMLNPRYSGLFVEYLGKPLLLVFGRPSDLTDLDDAHFTIRMYSAQHQANNDHLQGSWTWMNGTLSPLVTMYKGEAEALTASIGLFEPVNVGGWTGSGAYGRRGGWTLIETFKGVLQYRPRFTQIHQFQEFAGQYEGHGLFGPDYKYGDSYNVELSDDFEPVSLSTPAYRGHSGGWGFLYLNLVRALVDLYRQPMAETTVVAISTPKYHEFFTGEQLQVVWTSAGIVPESFTLAANGVTVASNVQDTQTVIDLSNLPNGPVTLRVTAEGTQCRYLPSYTEDSLPLEQMVPAYAEVEFFLENPRNTKSIVNWQCY